MPASVPVPSEDDEQMAFIEWLELVGLRFTSIPNNTWTSSWKQKSHNYYMGLRAGFPDLVVLVPPHRSRNGQGHFLAIEMKRRSGGRVSDVQTGWINGINGLQCGNIEARVCKGSKEAVDFVLTRLNPEPSDMSPF